MRGILNYNENKVTEGHAKCIGENLFGRDVDKLSFKAKLRGLENYLHRNRRATTTAVHISLNFHASEKLSEVKLGEIASTYMEKIGFGEQPYLVYQHFDAAHPHIHIVTTNIKSDGRRILLYNIGKNQSETARKEIEIQYNLVRASGRKQEHGEWLRPVDLEKAIYGKSETKRSISNIVRSVTRTYKYTSLPELNAVLRQYNVMADRGSEGSNMHNKKGLLYRLIDAQGTKVGVPIKASAIYGKPTLALLEKQFRLNDALRQPHKIRIKECVNEALKKSSGLSHSGGGNREEIFQQHLTKESIHALFRKNDEGRIYGVTFVDNKTRSVFNGSDLGKPYGAKGILERLYESPTEVTTSKTSSSDENKHPALQGESLIKQGTTTSPSPSTHVPGAPINELLTDLITAHPYDHLSPDAAMKRRKKKRKRKGHSL